MARKDKKPEIPPPFPSSSSATSSSYDATSTDSPPPKPTTIPSSPNPVTPSAQADTASSSSAASDDSGSDSPPPPKQPQPVSTSKRPAPGSGPEKKKPKKEENVVISALPTTNVDKRATDSGATGGTVVATPHKQLFQRIWSDEDEIVILKGMIDYKANKGTDPMSNVDDFLEFIKKSLKVADANKAQVVNKVKRLKTKFRNAKKKKTLTNPHEIEAFRLSKLIWGDEAEAEEVKVEKEEGREGWVIRKCEDVGEGGDVVFGFSGEDEVMLKEAMRVMEGSESRELKKKARSASLAYVEAYLMRLKVMQVAAQKVLDDLKVFSAD